MSARRVAVTGVGCLGSFGLGAPALASAMARGLPQGIPEQVETLRGRRRRMTVGRIGAFDRDAFIPPRKARRMGEVSQIWMVACLLARADAGLDASGGSDSGGVIPYPPERRGTYLGTGYGCIDTTWDYLLGLLSDGAGTANPFLFSESVANAPAGHSAIDLDTRGATVTFTCADASAASALQTAARAIRDDRIDLAYCGGVDLISEPLLRVLAAAGDPDFVGEGAGCLILEPLEAAEARGARVLAEVTGGAILSDPAAGPTDWSRDAARHAAVMRRALERDGAGPPRAVFTHAGPGGRAFHAEREAASSVSPGARVVSVTPVVGAFAAAGALTLAAAALEAAGSAGPGGGVLAGASGWGGTLAATVLRGR